jgi:hypothetical protein
LHYPGLPPPAEWTSGASRERELARFGADAADLVRSFKIPLAVAPDPDRITSSVLVEALTDWIENEPREPGDTARLQGET